jgi:WD repeat-containing protein 35
MFIYLNKKIKIAIPNPIDVNALSWNKEQGWIVVGGDEGLLKVLKLESLSTRENSAASSNLTMNQTLDGHNGAVQCVTWNEHYRKLTTSDQWGLIIVWMLYKGKWYEEMINNRNKSVVRDMKWNADGQKICIVYEDGAVIVGGVDGNRIWGKDLGTKLSNVAWSPDGKRILFGTDSYPHGEIHVYDDNGNKVDTVEIQCLEDVPGNAKITSIDWYDGTFGYTEVDCPTLCVCFDNGRLQIMQNEHDNSPIMVDTEMAVVACQWNQTGTVLAIAGSESSQGEHVAVNVNVVQFFNPMGDHLRTLKVPGNELRSLSWEGGGLRLTLAVDHFIFFANVRPDYKWGYFSDTVVYSFTKPERSENCVVFWDTKLNGHQIKYVKGLIGIVACGDYCVLSTKTDNDPAHPYVLILCNAIGTPVDSKYIDIEPVYVEMTKTHVVVASNECVYLWAHAASRDSELQGKKRKKDEQVFHIDDAPSSAKDSMEKFKKALDESVDPICSIAATETMLLVGKESGALQSYSLPSLSLGHSHQLNCRPDHLSINCDSTRVGIIDIAGILTLYDLEFKHTDPETGASQVGTVIHGFERKDVWNIMWAKDNPKLFAIMERTYMYIFRDTDPEEPFTSNGWICDFENLQVRSILLDDVMKDAEHPTKECIMDVEIKALRDTRALLDNVGVDDAAVFIEDNPHPRLWRLLAESALEKLDLDIADRAFVRCEDFQGIEFIKKLRRFDDEPKQRAEVAAYFHRFEEAEQIYLEMDRLDLAKQLRVKLGDWFRVVKLLNSTGSTTDDKTMLQAWSKIGDYYADRLKWEKAAKYYQRGGMRTRLAECYYMTENYQALSGMIYTLTDNDPLLTTIGEMFQAVGMCEQAVEAYNKCGQVQKSIACCVSLNQWDTAVELAPQSSATDVGSAYLANAQHLLKKEMEMEAIELYRKARHFLDAAKLLYDQAAKYKENPMRAKKLYVMAALQIEAHRNTLKSKSDDPTRSALDGLLAEDATTQAQSRMIDTAWRGAEAFHFLMLAQRQLYQGLYAQALATSRVLVEYDDMLDPVQAYSIYALAAIANKSYKECSKAFTKLESLSTLPEKTRELYENLALEIFDLHPPKKPAQEIDSATSFSKASVVTGAPVTSLTYWLCDVCAHRAEVPETESGSFLCCPLCYAPV